MRDKVCKDLPPNPHFSPGVRSGEGMEFCGEAKEVVAMDGKVNILGGMAEDETGTWHASDAVFVLDVVSQKPWKKVASMSIPRNCFGCGVLNGKIYAFGGNSANPGRGIECASEVYDPKEDVWSPISHMFSLRCLHRVETVGEELFVRDGNHVALDEDEAYDEDTHLHLPAKILEVYHPVTDEWMLTYDAVEFSIDKQRILWQNLPDLPKIYNNRPLASWPDFTGTMVNESSDAQGYVRIIPLVIFRPEYCHSFRAFHPATRVNWEVGSVVPPSQARTLPCALLWLTPLTAFYIVICPREGPWFA